MNIVHCCRCFANVEELSEQQRADLNHGIAAVEAFWAAVDADPFWQRPEQDPLYRCILSALSVRDILHEGGLTHARVLRSGLDVRQLAGGPGFSLTVGDPSAPRLERFWNAHMTVRLGDILLDPSHGQTKRFWNSSPKAAAFLVRKSGVEQLRLGRGSAVKVMSLHQHSEGSRVEQVTYFKLSRSVELRTRKWRNAPDARPERRRPIVRIANAIWLSRFETTMKAA